jgi:hypothetical protein
MSLFEYSGSVASGASSFSSGTKNYFVLRGAEKKVMGHFSMSRFPL